jgi:luciferase family oxidoreductase group 1
MTGPIALSVLDLATVAEGATEADAVNRSVALAQHAERLGYTRFWTAEHHSMPMIASSTPDLIALRIADTTSRIRVGAGGVMLPNHSPLQVTERYLTLEAFHPGRIDLGVGRAPGSDASAAVALRRSDAQSYPEQLAELDAYLDGPTLDSRSHVRAVPRGASRPPIYLLGSSLNSARLAAARGDAFAFAGHFSPDLAVPAMRTYREHFTPGTLQRPLAILAVAAIAADTGEHARWIAGSTRLAAVHSAHGTASALISPETASRHEWTERDLAIADSLTRSHIIGDQQHVHDALRALATETGADELMITAHIHNQGDHVRSLQLIAAALRAARDEHEADAPSTLKTR